MRGGFPRPIALIRGAAHVSIATTPFRRLRVCASYGEQPEPLFYYSPHYAPIADTVSTSCFSSLDRN